VARRKARAAYGLVLNEDGPDATTLKPWSVVRVTRRRSSVAPGLARRRSRCGPPAPFQDSTR